MTAFHDAVIEVDLGKPRTRARTSKEFRKTATSSRMRGSPMRIYVSKPLNILALPFAPSSPFRTEVSA